MAALWHATPDTAAAKTQLVRSMTQLFANVGERWVVKSHVDSHYLTRAIQRLAIGATGALSRADLPFRPGSEAFTRCKILATFCTA